MNCVDTANYLSEIPESYVINGYGRYAISDKVNLKLIGMFSCLLDKLDIDFGYRQRPKSFGTGIAYEVPKKLFILEQTYWVQAELSLVYLQRTLRP